MDTMSEVRNKPPDPRPRAPEPVAGRREARLSMYFVLWILPAPFIGVGHAGRILQSWRGRSLRAVESRSDRRASHGAIRGRCVLRSACRNEALPSRLGWVDY
jgi:hypothetical protein